MRDSGSRVRDVVTRERVWSASILYAMVYGEWLGQT